MTPDPVISELHRIKDEIAKEFNYDVHALFEHIRQLEKTSGRTYVSFEKPKKITKKRAATATKKTARPRKAKSLQRAKHN